MTIPTNKGADICKALGIPADRTTKIDISVSPNNIVTVTAVILPDSDGIDALTEVLKRYELVESRMLNHKKRTPLFKAYPPEFTDICIAGEIAVLKAQNRTYPGPLGEISKAAAVAQAIVTTHAQLHTALSQRMQ